MTMGNECTVKHRKGVIHFSTAKQKDPSQAIWEGIGVKILKS